MQYRGILKVTLLPLCLDSQGHDAQLSFFYLKNQLWRDSGKQHRAREHLGIKETDVPTPACPESPSSTGLSCHKHLS